MDNTIYIFAWGNTPERVVLKGRPCKILSPSPLHSCEVLFVDTGQREVVNHQALRCIRCLSCGQPLIETDFNRGYCLRQCNNINCKPLYAERQGLRERVEGEGEAYRKRRNMHLLYLKTDGKGRKLKDLSPERRAAMDRRMARPGYAGWVAQKKENYHRLRELGYSCKEAVANASKKRMEALGILDAG